MIKQIALFGLLSLVNCYAAHCDTNEYEYQYEEEYQMAEYCYDKEIHCDEVLNNITSHEGDAATQVENDQS